LDHDFGWLLRCAFSFELPSSWPQSEPRVIELARVLQCAGRVGRRLEIANVGEPRSTLRRELVADYHENVATEALLLRAHREIARLGEQLDVPVIPLKFAGLRLLGVGAPGNRLVSDLDLLVPKNSARTFWRALLDAGYRRTYTREYPHQLETLFEPHGAVIDLHVHVPGVFVEQRKSSRDFATAEQLLERDLVVRSSSASWIPKRPLLAAHAISHGLLQNRSTPQTHSPLRMISDLMDLRAAEPAVLTLAEQHLAPELGMTCATLERLCSALSSESFARPSFADTAEQALLWHCLAARVDLDYSERLRAAGLANKIRDGASLAELLDYLANLFYPGERELEILYGPATGPFGRARRRAKRPIDLAVRAARRWARSR
jgi:hypothetical protein